MKKYQDKLVDAAQDLEALRRDTHSKDFAEAIRLVEGRLIKVADDIATDHHIFARVQYGALKALYEVFESDTHPGTKADIAISALKLFWNMGDGQGPWLISDTDVSILKDFLGDNEE